MRTEEKMTKRQNGKQTRYLEKDTQEDYDRKRKTIFINRQQEA